MKKNNKGFGIIDIIIISLIFIFFGYQFLEIHERNKSWERKRKERERKENILKERETKRMKLADELDNNPNSQQDRINEANNILKLMVKCPAGTFLMGSPETELGRSKSETQHKVTLTKDFYIAKYTVTQEQFKNIMGFNPSFYGGDGNPESDRIDKSRGDCPVENVSWYEAKDFCVKLNKFTEGKRPSGYKFDLPTEAQWEYACRAGTTTAFNNGKNLTTDSQFDDCPNCDEVAWYERNHEWKFNPQPPGKKKPNAWGIYDMHGNVYEWCRDNYGFFTSDDVVDPQGPTSGEPVIKGGSISSRASDCRAATRFQYHASGRSKNYGFRVALVCN